MTTILLIIHIVLALAIILLVLLQRGTGGGLGLGESGGMGGFATPRSAANILTKATTWCALLFFATSLSLAILASRGSSSGVLDQLQQVPADQQTQGSPATTSTSILPKEGTIPTPPVDLDQNDTPQAPVPPGAVDKPEAPATP